MDQTEQKYPHIKGMKDTLIQSNIIYTGTSSL